MAREECVCVCVCVCVLRWNKEVQRGEVCPIWFLWDPKKQKELTNPKLAEAAHEGAEHSASVWSQTLEGICSLRLSLPC